MQAEERRARRTARGHRAATTATAARTRTRGCPGMARSPRRPSAPPLRVRPAHSQLSESSALAPSVSARISGPSRSEGASWRVSDNLRSKCASDSDRDIGARREAAAKAAREVPSRLRRPRHPPASLAVPTDFASKRSPLCDFSRNERFL